MGEGVVKGELRVLETSGFLCLDVIGCQEFVGDVFKVVGGHRGGLVVFQSGFSLSEGW